ncbi:MAG TPA: hypothetical protein VFN97_01035 [Actinospica sp.]|nr:hypothetical protein [Actinospica sp.]
MTDTMIEAAAEEVEQPRERRHPLAANPLVTWLAPWLCATVGALLIALAYSIASNDGHGIGYFAIFWIGALLLFLPAAAVISSRRVSSRLRFGWLLVYALFTYVPKLLRDPAQPLFHDEIAQWRQAADLAVSGHLFQPNYIIGIVARFPGLHIVTASISDSTGLSVWQSAILILVVAHILATFGAYSLGDTVFGDQRAGAVVALVYSLNSSFMYFDTEFAYESLAMPFFLWCLACLARAHRAETARERIAWAGGAIVAGFGVITTHHLTTVFLSLLLLVVCATTLLAAWRGLVSKAVAWTTVGVFLGIVGTAVCWLVLVAPATFGYLSPYLGGGASQLLNMFSSKGGTRSLFQGATEPFYEKYSSYTVPLLAFALVLIALWLWRRTTRKERREEPMRLALMLFGLLYFPSLPFILVEFGAEGARRSWGFTYIGVATLVTPVILAGLDRLAKLRGRTLIAAGTAALLVAGDAFVGNVAAGLDTDYRFPGPFVFGSDTRSVTPELVGLAAWFGQNLGPQQHIVTDRYTGLILVRDADAEPASPAIGFPTYDLYFNDGPPGSYLVYELSSSHYAYLIIDKRMATQLPEVGVFFEPDEPFAYGGRDPITVPKLDRYDFLPWTTEVFDSDDYAVYRFDFSAIHDPRAAGAAAEAKGAQ